MRITLKCQFEGHQKNSGFIFFAKIPAVLEAAMKADFAYTDYVRRGRYFHQHICFRGTKEGTNLYVQNLQELYRESTTLAWKPSLALSIDIKLPDIKTRFAKGNTDEGKMISNKHVPQTCPPDVQIVCISEMKTLQNAN